MIVGLCGSAIALALAPVMMPSGYSWVSNTTSESAAQRVHGAWLGRMGLWMFGLSVLSAAVAVRDRLIVSAVSGADPSRSAIGMAMWPDVDGPLRRGDRGGACVRRLTVVVGADNSPRRPMRFAVRSVRRPDRDGHEPADGACTSEFAPLRRPPMRRARPLRQSRCRPGRPQFAYPVALDITEGGCAVSDSAMSVPCPIWTMNLFSRPGMKSSPVWNATRLPRARRLRATASTRDLGEDVPVLGPRVRARRPPARRRALEERLVVAAHAVEVVEVRERAGVVDVVADRRLGRSALNTVDHRVDVGPSAMASRYRSCNATRCRRMSSGLLAGANGRSLPRTSRPMFQNAISPVMPGPLVTGSMSTILDPACSSPVVFDPHVGVRLGEHVPGAAHLDDDLGAEHVGSARG